jgi:ribonuclease BN (tRNA processing enzyme)
MASRSSGITVSGRVLGYSADTAYDPSLIEWLARADLIVHEATLAHTGVHTPYEKLVALPEAIRSKLRLTHSPDDFDVEGSAIEALQEGRINSV